MRRRKHSVLKKTFEKAKIKIQKDLNGINLLNTLKEFQIFKNVMMDNY
jgi:hypothetical protein